MRTSTDWTMLVLSFAAGLIFAIAWVLCVYVTWRRGKFPSGGVKKRVPLWSSLSGLSASWSFHDSWATNVTAGSGLLVLVLGSSDVLKNVLPPNSEATINVVTVAGAVAVALIGAAGVLVLTLKAPNESETSVLGLLAGTSVALGAAAGEVWVMTFGFTKVNLGGSPDFLKWVVASAATALLAGYALTSIHGLLTQGAPWESVTDAPPSGAAGAAQPAAPISPSPSLAAASASPVDAVANAIVQASNNQPVNHQDIVEALSRFPPLVDLAKREPLRYRSALP